MSQESVVATGAAEVIVAVKSRGGEVGRQALALGLHWRDSVLAIDPEQLADFPSTQTEKARREASRARGPASDPVKEKRKLKSDRVTFHGKRRTTKSDRKMPSKDPRSQEVKEIVRKHRLARDIARVGDPFDDVSLEKKKQFGLSFYFKKLKVCIKEKAFH